LLCALQAGCTIHGKSHAACMHIQFISACTALSSNNPDTLAAKVRDQ